MFKKLIDWIFDKIIFCKRKVRVIELTDPIYISFNRSNEGESFAVITLDFVSYVSYNKFTDLCLNLTMLQSNDFASVNEISNDKSDLLNHSNTKLKYRFKYNGYDKIYHICNDKVNELDLNKYFDYDVLSIDVDLWDYSRYSKNLITNLYYYYTNTSDGIKRRCLYESDLYYSYKDAKYDLDLKLDTASRKMEIERLKRLSEI